jgi:hypothetical protein
MGWLIAVCVVGVVIYLLVVSKRFRLGFVIVVALIGGGIWLFVKNQEAAEQRSLSLVNPSEIELRNLQLASDYGSYKLRGENTPMSAVAFRSLTPHRRETATLGFTVMTSSVSPYYRPGFGS